MSKAFFTNGAVPATILTLAGCGGMPHTINYHVGPTKVSVHDGAQPWTLLPEAVFALQFVAMQMFPNYVEEISDIDIHVWNPWQMVPRDQGRDPLPCFSCIYHPSNGDIHVRTFGLQPSQSCLAHEWEHRIEHVITGDPNADHAEPFFANVNLLNAFLRELEAQ